MTRHFVWLLPAFFLTQGALWSQEDAEESDAPAAEVKAEPKKKQKKEPPTIPADIKTELDVDFLEGDRKEKADLYFPQNVPPGQKCRP